MNVESTFKNGCERFLNIQVTASALLTWLVENEPIKRSHFSHFPPALPLVGSMMPTGPNASQTKKDAIVGKEFSRTLNSSWQEGCHPDPSFSPHPSPDRNYTRVSTEHAELWPWQRQDQNRFPALYWNATIALKRKTQITDSVQTKTYIREYTCSIQTQ